VPDGSEPTEFDGGTPPSTHSFDFNASLGPAKPLPPGTLSSEAIERLRAGGSLSDEELDRLRAAVAADRGLVGTLLESVLAGAISEQQDVDRMGAAAPAGNSSDPDVVSIPISSRTFAWSPEQESPSTATEPATYYEALTGRPDPMRGFFVASRRVLNIVTWAIALGIPLGLMALGVAVGESPDTIALMGFAGLLVGMLFKSSLPKTPFG
jgi:hypothetical protein